MLLPANTQTKGALKGTTMAGATNCGDYQATMALKHIWRHSHKRVFGQRSSGRTCHRVVIRQSASCATPSKLNSHSEYAFLRSDRFDPRHPVQEIKTACQRIVRELEPITDEWQEDFDQSRHTFDIKYDQYQNTKEETFRTRLERVPFAPGRSYLAPSDCCITGAESEIPYDPVFGPDGQLATPPPRTSQHVTEW